MTMLLQFMQIHKLLLYNVTFEQPESLCGHLLFLKRVPCSYRAWYKGVEVVVCPGKWTLQGV